MCTYVCVRPLISARAGERDEFMAPLVDHETANCRETEETKRLCLVKGDKERDKDGNIKMGGQRTGRWRDTAKIQCPCFHVDAGDTQLINCPD